MNTYEFYDEAYRMSAEAARNCIMNDKDGIAYINANLYTFYINACNTYKEKRNALTLGEANAHATIGQITQLRNLSCAIVNTACTKSDFLYDRNIYRNAQIAQYIC